MQYIGYGLLWLFLAYSFLGWVLETAAAAVKQKKFVNRGMINGPFCIIYGTAAVLMSIGLHEVTGIWLFFLCYETLFEFIFKRIKFVKGMVANTFNPCTL